MSAPQAGFTVLEMVLVTATLVALAAIAVPRLSNLHADAEQAGVDRVAVALAAASARNRDARRLDAGHGVAVSDCVHLTRALEAGLDGDYEIVPGTGIDPGGTASCRVRRVDDPSVSQSFVAHGIR